MLEKIKGCIAQTVFVQRRMDEEPFKLSNYEHKQYMLHKQLLTNQLTILEYLKDQIPALPSVKPTQNHILCPREGNWVLYNSKLYKVSRTHKYTLKYELENSKGEPAAFTPRDRFEFPIPDSYWENQTFVFGDKVNVTDTEVHVGGIICKLRNTLSTPFSYDVLFSNGETITCSAKDIQPSFLKEKE